MSATEIGMQRFPRTKRFDMEERKTHVFNAKQRTIGVSQCGVFGVFWMRGNSFFVAEGAMQFYLFFFLLTGRESDAHYRVTGVRRAPHPVRVARSFNVVVFRSRW